MLIAVNLLPGANKPSVLRSEVHLQDTFRSVVASVRDPLLLGAVSLTMLSVGGVAWLYSSQQTRAEQVARALEEAVQDSTRLSSAIAAQRKLTAERDSVQRQLAIIRSIDETRYRWAHILDEVSRALPAYTWLVSMEQTSKPPRAPAPDSTGEAAAGAGAGAGAAAGAAAAPPGDGAPATAPLTFKLVGQTIDIQALTLFMRQLEASPFLAAVTLSRSEIAVVEGKDVTQFELTVSYEPPPPGVVQSAPLVIPIR